MEEVPIFVQIVKNKLSKTLKKQDKQITFLDKQSIKVISFYLSVCIGAWPNSLKRRKKHHKTEWILHIESNINS